MKKIIPIILILGLFLPVLALAKNTEGLVPCGNGATCTVDDAFELIARIVRFLIFTVAMPLCALAITYGGIQMAMSSTNPSGKEKGKTIVITAATGLLIALASYLIVDTILTFFTGDSLDTLNSQL